MRLNPQIRSGEGSRRGVALVITLIMLSVITFMAVTFLILTQRERKSVVTTTDQTVARFAADTALQRFIMEMLAPLMAQTNDQLIGLCVSTNYRNAAGFQTGVSSYTNVNYFYPNSSNITGNDVFLNLANQFYNPSPPVWVTNRSAPYGYDLRFYLDLNRNGRYDTNGVLPVIGLNGLPLTVGTNLVYGSFAGDPEWIGILQHPEWPHSPSNQYVARFAYIAVPSGRTLDLNSIHNQAKAIATPPQSNQARDGYIRDQGVGPWEVNLAAGLTDLNTNQWNPRANPYFYDRNTGSSSTGAGFDDSLAILRYTYNGNIAFLNYLLPVQDNPVIDEYGNGTPAGTLMTGSKLTGDINDTGVGFPGADRPNHLFTLQEPFDKAKIVPAGPVGFADRMYAAGTNVSSYDRYTYYRWLSQFGFESAPEKDKLNINFKNVDAAGIVVPGMETNAIAWTNAAEFFTNAADRLMRATYFGGGITSSHIQLWPTNQYTPSVHRLLQVAANIYDSTTNRSTVTGFPYLPSVFRPLVRRDASDDSVYVVGYREVTDDSLTQPGVTAVDLSITADRTSVPPIGTAFNSNDKLEPLVYGLPLVVGVKQSLPNFNELAMQTLLRVTRKLEFRRNTLLGDIVETNQMYIIDMSTAYGVEAWNSYSNAFPRNLRIGCAGEITMVFSNEVGVIRSNQMPFSIAPTNITNWPGFSDAFAAQQPSFVVPVSNSVVILTNSVWRPLNPTPVGQVGASSPAVFDRVAGGPSMFHVPRWWVSLRSRLRFYVVDAGTSRIVDYVNISAEENPLDITAKLIDQLGPNGCGFVDNSGNGNMWCTNRVNGSTDVHAPTYGILNQIWAGRTGNALNTYVLDRMAGTALEQAVDGFRYQFLPLRPDGSLPAANPIFPADIGKTFYRSNIFYAPLDPSTQIAIQTRLQANDPLVHYLPGDLLDLSSGNTNVTFQSENPPLANLGRINTRYEPWGGNPSGGSASLTKFEVAFKDPLVRRSDDWDFPTNRYPGLGWLGRVHRGTPWQTIYMKARDLSDTNLWIRWTGNNKYINYRANLLPDFLISMPVRDRDIFDLFTTAINENAARGKLSINQDGLAAWSAVLSGVLVLTNTSPDPGMLVTPIYSPMAIPPAGDYTATEPTPVVRILTGINNTRADGVQFPDRVFSRLGDILAVPELTIGSTPSYVGTYPGGYWTNASPFLNLGNPDPAAVDANSRLPAAQSWGISERAYERIPQQIMSLLTVDHTPRYAVYAYGQTLRPAEHSILTSGTFSGMCTNYQVTAEWATRTVVRVEGSFNPRDANNPDPLRRYPPHAVFEQFNPLPPD